MFERYLFRSLCGIALALSGVAAVFAADKPVVENFADGTKKLTYSLNPAGQKQGVENEFYPSGKRHITSNYNNGKKNGSYVELFESGKVRIRANYLNDEYHGKFQELTEDGTTVLSASYRNGKRHGSWQEYEGKNLVKDEFYADGFLLLPRSQAQISAQLAAINKAPVVTDGEVPADVTADIKSRVNDPALQADRETGVRNLNGYRYLCGLPYDVGLDRAHIAYAEAGADLLKAIGKLDHTPANPGMPEDQYKAGYKGTSSSNIFSGQKAVGGTVHGYMDDSDKSNIDRLGHRRWCLNPKMARTGFGINGGFSCMWSFNGSRQETVEFDHVAFPPAGLVPNAVFKKDYAWSVSLNPAKYKKPDEKSVKVKVFQAKLNTQTGNVDKAPQPLELNYFGVDNGGFGISNCIIFRPAPFSTDPGAAYWCEITGLEDMSGQPAKLEYFVGFFKL